MSTSVGADFPRMMSQVTEMREQARRLGPNCAFYVAVCDDLLKRADEAWKSGDVLRILPVYKEMQELS